MGSSIANICNSIVYFMSAVASPVFGFAVDRTGYNLFWCKFLILSLSSCYFTSPFLPCLLPPPLSPSTLLPLSFLLPLSLPLYPSPFPSISLSLSFYLPLSLPLPPSFSPSTPLPPPLLPSLSPSTLLSLSLSNIWSVSHPWLSCCPCIWRWCSIYTLLGNGT